VVGGPLFARLPVDAATSAALRASADKATTFAQHGMAQLPTFAQWLVSLVPANPFRAASDGAMLPLIVFTLAFGIALLHVRADRRAAVVGFFAGLLDAMLVLVRWVLELAPYGVFALALALGATLGVRAAGTAAYFVAAVCAACTLFGVVLYPVTALLGRIPLAEFARAAAPAQAVAFSSRSSLASLPVMMEQSAVRLRLPAQVTSFLLPLAASVFRAGAGVGVTLGVLFVARLYGIALSAPQLATVVVTVTLVSFSIPGIPNGSILVMVPVLLAAGIPVAGIGILLGLDTIPDMFRTTLNVTADMSAAAIVARAGGGAPAASAAPRAALAPDPLDMPLPRPEPDPPLPPAA
jgi:Na+/H+-dicarboxylate symporter